jgi:hypothetical protein
MNPAMAEFFGIKSRTPDVERGLQKNSRMESIDIPIDIPMIIF